jgi:hypothetical protein
MSKESQQAFPCACGGNYAFPLYHMPHCKGAAAHPRNRARLDHILDAAAAGVNALMSSVAEKVVGAEKLHSEAKNEEKATRKRRHSRKATHRQNSAKKGKGKR